MANDKDTVNDAPRIDAGGHIPPAEEKRLFAYYLTADRTEGIPERTAPDHDTEMPLDDAGRDRDFDNDPDTRGATPALIATQTTTPTLLSRAAQSARRGFGDMSSQTRSLRSAKNRYRSMTRTQDG